MIYYGCDPGQVVRWLNGGYTGAKRDIKQILRSVKPHVSNSDFTHIKRILTEGCPASLNYDEEATRKLAMMKQGYQKVFF